jgi:hypothetical protein
MPISSASTKIFEAKDTVMETDLDLMAKVDSYKEEQFVEGEKDIQGEINNWSQLRNVAKPQDKQYINGKLTDLVTKINSMGGVNLSDAGNVNTIKNLGYSLYADKGIMNAVSTTKRMQALQQDIANKTNGKNAKDYDPVYGEYLANTYSDWLNDGKTGTGFEGPSSLPQGNFSQYQTRLEDKISKLTPDLNEAPQGTAEALNYYQVGDKFIKKERIDALIDANTTEQDKAIINAHAWKGFQGYSDSSLLGLQNRGYDSKIASLQDTWNTLQHQKALSKGNWDQQELFTKQMTDVQNAIQGIKGQKGQLPDVSDGQPLPKQFRENLQSSLFNDAFRDNMSTAWAFDQKKVELKTNTAKIDQLKMAQQDLQFGKMYDLHLKDYDLKKDELALKKDELTFKMYGILGMGGLNGPAGNAPLSLVTTLGKDNATKIDNNVIEKADANYIKAATEFNTNGYNYLMTKDANLYGKFLQKDADGNYIPKDQRSSDIVRKALGQAVDLYGNIANMSVAERKGLELAPEDQQFFESSETLKQAQLYKNQMQSVAEQVFRSAGKESPYTKPISIKLRNGQNITTTPEGQPLTYASLKEMIDRKDPVLDTWKNHSANVGALLNSDVDALAKKYGVSRLKANTADFIKAHQSEFDALENKYGIDPKNVQGSTGNLFSSEDAVSVAQRTVKNYYDSDDVKKSWDDVSKTFNVYGATPNLSAVKKEGKLNDQIANYIGGAVRDQHHEIAAEVKDSDVDILKVYPVFDATNSENPVKYLADVKYRSGAGNKKESGDKTTTVDLTQVVNQQQKAGGGFFSNLYPQDNAEIVYGMILNDKGQTPMDPKDNYSTALQTHSSGYLTHKFQVVSVRNPTTKGVEEYRINVLIPKGKDANGVPQFQTVPVKNFDPSALTGKAASYSFPANFKTATKYMDSMFSTADRARTFYKLHGIPYNE